MRDSQVAVVAVGVAVVVSAAGCVCVSQTTMELSVTHANNKDAVKLIYSSLVLIAKIFYSLNFQVSDTSAFYVVLKNCRYS